MGGSHGQKHNPYIKGKYGHLNKNDVVFTPDWLCEKICSMFNIVGDVLEPCKGEGAFMNHLPKNTEWCEITEGRNYYDYNKKVDWIVTNPPYSDFNRFLEHSFNLAENIVLVLPLSKMFKSMGTIKSIMNYGGIVSVHFLSSSKAGFPFGFPSGIFHLKRGYNGKTLFKELDLEEIKDNESICSRCSKKVNDDTETKWSEEADPYCSNCFKGNYAVSLTSEGGRE